MIEKIEVPLPKGIEVREICLDRRCLQKELRPTKRKSSPESRPIDRIYYETDFITRMTAEEKEKWNIISE